MTDDILDKLPDEELTDEEHEALLLKSEHAIGPPLSPAARAVLDAFGRHPINHDCPSIGILYGALPAALRAAADQVVPEKLESYGIRYELLRIADELEQLDAY
jgi:hypothetical protein